MGLLSHGLGGRLPSEEPRIPQLSPVQIELPQRGHVGGGAEEPGVAGHAAQRGRVLVVHLALQPSPPPGAVPGGGDVLGGGGRIARAKSGGLQAQRLQDQLPQGDVQGAPGDADDGLAQQDEPQVAVEDAGPGGIAEIGAQRGLHNRLGRAQPVERIPGRKPGGVGQEVAEGDPPRVHGCVSERHHGDLAAGVQGVGEGADGAGAAKLRQHLGHRLVKPDPSGLHQDQEGRGGEELGQRG